MGGRMSARVVFRPNWLYFAGEATESLKPLEPDGAKNNGYL